MDLASWIVGLLLIVLTIAIHTTGVVAMAFRLEARIRGRAGNDLGPRRTIPIVSGSIGVVALLLAVLHGVESVLWASAYRWLGAFDSFTDASIYSLGTMVSFDVPGLELPDRLRLISALEAANGVLLFGISTAFLFAVMQAYFLTFFRRHRDQTDTRP
ncbi:hypothetical protein [Mycobacterium sp. NAZ190054]|uniref:hypothetical protein n=1 Tax=Mycobacterium sp. NAZ190054 TaxID=1747766 RepID=UPI000797C322|nr:hypothetical protein [Mycobacterium sp. NAZ190054]KWX68762.1 hypothetical protein ASJ79_02705 [Mycobacterium sp. NAZ190054]